MKKYLVTHNEIAEAIARYTTCMSTRELPGAIANYFMITKRFYTRTNKAVINRLLLAEIRDYLSEQGRLHYATLAAEMRKEARKLCSEKPVRNNDFIARVKDELDGEDYEIFVPPMDKKKGLADQVVIVMTYKQAL